MRALALTCVIAACGGADPSSEDSAVATEVVADTLASDATLVSDTTLVIETAVDETSADIAEVEVVAARPWPESCELVTSDSVPVPEASGAVWLDDGRALVVADSGNAGRAIIIDLVSLTSSDVTLPLGIGGDDIEDLTRAPDGRIVGLSSPGWLYAWRLDGGTFVLEGPTPIADEGDWRCDVKGVNCAANFEGFCLHPAPDSDCVGWAASKARGVLVCVVASGASYTLDTTRTITVAEPDALSGCAFEPVAPYRLVVTGNFNVDSPLWQVDPDSGAVTRFEANGTGVGNQEALLISRSGELHSFGDLQQVLPDASPHQVLVCPGSRAAVPSPR